MVDKTVTQETAGGAVADADLLRTVQGGASVKTTFAQIKTWIKSWIVKGDVGLGNVQNVDTTTQANVAFTGLAAAAAVADADTLPVNQGATNVKQTFAAIKTWIQSWVLTFLYASKIDAQTGATVTLDLSGVSQVQFNAGSATTINSYSNIVVGRFYHFRVLTGNYTFNRNAAQLLGSVNKTPAANTSAVFVGLSSTIVTQVTEFAATG